MSILQPPGTYTVKLSAAGQELSQPLVVKKDPNSSGTEADIQTQIAMLTELRSELDTAATMVNQIEFVRSQLLSIRSLLGSQRGQHAAIISASEELDKKLIEVEEQLIQRRLTGQGQDTVRWPPKLLTKINYLANGLAGSDFGPTTQQREVQAIFKQQVASHKARLNELLTKDLSAFNNLLRERGIQNIITRP